MNSKTTFIFDLTTGAQPDKGAKVKMNIQILETRTFSNEFANYSTTVFECEKVKCTVTRAQGHYNYINVTVHNAMHRAFRGLGKDFKTIEEALTHYKSEKIKSILYHFQKL